MGRKIKIPLNHFPSDREIHDLVMSSLTTPKKVQEVLLKFGIVVQTRDRQVLADCISSLILDHEQLLQLIDSTNVRESRVKTSVVELSIPGATIEDVFQAMLESDIPLSDPETRLKIDSRSNPTFKKEDDQIELIQPFKKIDYSKNFLIQEEPNEFSIRAEKITASKIKLTCSTSNTSSEFYFKAIKQELLKKIKEKKPTSDPYFWEILASEIPTDKLNDFFESLIKSSKLDLNLTHVSAIQMAKPESFANSESEESSSNTGDGNDQEDQSENQTTIRQLKFLGKNLLAHQDIQNKVNEGFVIKSLEAYFYSEGDMKSKRHFLIAIGFGAGNKFFSEIKSCEIETEASSKKEAINLSTAEREACLSPLNIEAFTVYESLRKKEGSEK